MPRVLVLASILVVCCVGHGIAEGVPLELPRVEDAAPLGVAPDYVVTIDADGLLQHGVAGKARAAGVLTADAEASLETLVRLGTGWQMKLKGVSSPLVLVRADRRLPWTALLPLLRAGVEHEDEVRRWAFATEAEGHAVRYEHDGAVGEGEEPPVPLLLQLDVDDVGRRWLRAVELKEPRRRGAVQPFARVELGRAGALARLASAAIKHATRKHPAADGAYTARIEATPQAARQLTVGHVLPLVAFFVARGVPVHLAETPSPGSLHGDSSGGKAPVRELFGAPAEDTEQALRRREAVGRGLRWLAAHQAENGSWEAGGFALVCDGEPIDEGPLGAGLYVWNNGLTGLTLLAFLGAGHDGSEGGRAGRAVQRGLRYLRRIQDEEGCFGPREPRRWTYTQAICTWAMVEAYGLTASPVYARAAQRGLDLVRTCRNPYYAWRYGVQPGEGDTSVTAWMMMPIFAAQIVNADRTRRGQPAPLVVDEDAQDGARAWLDRMTDRELGRTGYIVRGGGSSRSMSQMDRFPADRSEAMTAAALTLRVFMGEDVRRSRAVERGLDLLDACLPSWEQPHRGTVDLYYWMWGTMATWQRGGAPWRRWSRALDRALVPNQRVDTTVCFYRGSWDPDCAWGVEGGRVYATAMACLALEPERFARR